MSQSQQKLHGGCMIRWFIKHRMSFIDKFSKENGCINRSDLIKEYGMSGAQASNDIKRFNDTNPGLLKYNWRYKMYERERK